MSKLPLRSVEYACVFPSGDQTGLYSAAALFVSWTASPPSAGLVQSLPRSAKARLLPSCESAKDAAPPFAANRRTVFSFESEYAKIRSGVGRPSLDSMVQGKLTL